MITNNTILILIIFAIFLTANVIVWYLQQPSTEITPQSLKPLKGIACTQIGCQNGLFLSVPPQYVWKPGKYIFNFEFDNKKILCKGRFPSTKLGERISCNSREVQILQIDPYMTTKTTSINKPNAYSIPKKVEMNTGNLPGTVTFVSPPPKPGFDFIILYSSPKKGNIIITRDGVEIAHQSFVAKYQLVYPNGKECGGACQQSHISLHIH